MKANFCVDTCRNWLKQYFLHIIYKVSQPGHNWPFTCLPDNDSMNKTILKGVLHRSIHFIFNSLISPIQSQSWEWCICCCLATTVRAPPPPVCSCCGCVCIPADGSPYWSFYMTFLITNSESIVMFPVIGGGRSWAPISLSAAWITTQVLHYSWNLMNI